MSSGRIPSVEGGIQPTIVDAKGDLIVATAADTVSRLAVGTNNHVLTADSSTSTGLKWAAVAAGGKVLQVVQDTSTTNETTTSTTYTDTALSQAITPSATSSKVLVIAAFTGGIVRTASDDTNALYNLVRGSTQLATTLIGLKTAAGNSVARGFGGFVYLDSPNTTSATTYKIQFKADNGTAYMAMDGNFASLTLIEIGA